MISRPGNTSRSARFWASRSPPPSLPGWCRSRLSSRLACRARLKTPSRSSICAATSRGGSTSSSRWCSSRPDTSATQIAKTNARELYWTSVQQLAHAASNGAIVRAGDLYASGTISGRESGSQGSLIELTWNGERPLELGGVSRTYLEDGDTVTIKGWGRAHDPERAIGFGAVSGAIVAS